MLTEVALFVCQVSVVDWPFEIALGLAVRDTTGAACVLALPPPHMFSVNSNPAMQMSKAKDGNSFGRTTASPQKRTSPRYQIKCITGW
jgi:hypothetical protein